MNRNDENPVFERVVEMFNKMAVEEYRAKYGQKSRYREIHLKQRGIKSKVHYEFSDNRDARTISAENPSAAF